MIYFDLFNMLFPLINPAHSNAIHSQSRAYTREHRMIQSTKVQKNTYTAKKK